MTVARAQDAADGEPGVGQMLSTGEVRGDQRAQALDRIGLEAAIALLESRNAVRPA